jgi:hypothetical protein
MAIMATAIAACGRNRRRKILATTGRRRVNSSRVPDAERLLQTYARRTGQTTNLSVHRGLRRSVNGINCRKRETRPMKELG